MRASSRSATTASCINGAQQLATGGAISDYIYLSCIHPLQPGDEAYANCVAVPVNAPGVKLYPRRPYAAGGSALDYPLSRRFDETDCFVVLDNVFVPWEHVFIYRNTESAAINGGRRRRISMATIRPRRATRPSFAS